MASRRRLSFPLNPWVVHVERALHRRILPRRPHTLQHVALVGYSAAEKSLDEGLNLDMYLEVI
jgi:hypothetical protein